MIKIFEESTEYLEALNLSLEMWNWLKENPKRKKHWWHKYETHKDSFAIAQCPICTIRKIYMDSSTDYLLYCYGYNEHKKTMNKCPFIVVCANHRWKNGTIEERKIYAERACEALRAERNKVIKSRG